LPRRCGLENGVWKERPDIPLVRWGTALARSAPARKHSRRLSQFKGHISFGVSGRVQRTITQL
jgi:hypothetical protein